ncbi:hypothetical protein BDW62DRAFT_203244 [Aspergillus aurantiobrunneus]
MSSKTNNHRQIPSSEWIRGRAAPYECTTCTLCATGDTDCPTANHPFNLELQTGLRCYKCSSCSHKNFVPKTSKNDDSDPATKKLNLKDLPTPYKKPSDRYYTDNFTWYVSLPVEEKCNSEILKLRVGLAELQNAKATIYPNTTEGIDWGRGYVFGVHMKDTADVKMVLEEAREIIRDRLRANVRVWESEVSLNIWN